MLTGIGFQLRIQGIQVAQIQQLIYLFRGVVVLQEHFSLGFQMPLYFAEDSPKGIRADLLRNQTSCSHPVTYIP